MEEVLNVVILGRAARNAANIKNRQPIGKMFVGAPKALDATFTAIIADELNVKEVEFTTDAGAFLSYNIKPNLKTVGPKYGKQLGEIRTLLAAADGTALESASWTPPARLHSSTGGRQGRACAGGSAD